MSNLIFLVLGVAAVGGAYAVGKKRAARRPSVASGGDDTTPAPTNVKSNIGTKVPLPALVASPTFGTAGRLPTIGESPGKESFGGGGTVPPMTSSGGSIIGGKTAGG